MGSGGKVQGPLLKHNVLHLCTPGVVPQWTVLSDVLSGADEAEPAGQPGSQSSSQSAIQPASQPACLWGMLS